MINNTFFLVMRPDNLSEVNSSVKADRHGWEFIDKIEYTDYNEALTLMKEYSSAFPNHTVRIRAIPTKVGLYSQKDIDTMRMGL